MSGPFSLHSPTRVFDLLRRQLENFPKPDALAYKVNGAWKTFSTQEVVDSVDQLGWGLHLASIRKGDRVANVTETNRPEWNFIDLAVMSLGAVHVPIYPNISTDEYQFILTNSGAKLVFVSSVRLFKIIRPLAERMPGLLGIYSYDPVEGANLWTKLRDHGREGLRDDRSRAELEAKKAGVAPGDLATLIYTSGTTGPPKGVMLSHANLLSNCLECSNILASNAHERALSFLPLCHIYERTVINIYLSSGTSVYYAENLNTIAENLREVRPELFSTVPRLLEKVYERILARGEQLTGLKRKVFFWALDLGLRFDPATSPGWVEHLKLVIADRLVFSKWREALGGRVRGIISGSAALQPRLARVFWAAKMPVYEGYGPTEASPVISVNRPNGDTKIGTVGPVIGNGEVKIAEDGEILYRGPNVMLGYYERPDLTAESIDAEGWLHTGDVGEFDGKFLKITDRKKEIFKTSGGKYIAPQQVENKLKESPFVSQVMVIGENHKFPAALIVPSFETVAEHFHPQGVRFESRLALVNDSKVLALFEAELQRINPSFGRYMQVKKFALLAEEWTTSGGELTPTLKLKRKHILQKYGKEVETLYASEEHGSELLQTPDEKLPLKVPARRE
jgi:long-chain acyl-CoA synthetase